MGWVHTTCDDCEALFGEIVRLRAKVADLELTAACAEGMRDAADAQIEYLRGCIPHYPILAVLLSNSEKVRS